MTFEELFVAFDWPPAGLAWARTCRISTKQVFTMGYTCADDYFDLFTRIRYAFTILFLYSEIYDARADIVSILPLTPRIHYRDAMIIFISLSSSGTCRCTTTLASDVLFREFMRRWPSRYRYCRRITYRRHCAYFQARLLRRGIIASHIIYWSAFILWFSAWLNSFTDDSDTGLRVYSAGCRHWYGTRRISYSIYFILVLSGLHYRKMFRCRYWLKDIEAISAEASLWFHARLPFSFDQGASLTFSL